MKVADSVCIVFDESIDDNDNYVLHIIAVPQISGSEKLQSFLLDSPDLNLVNYSTMWQAVMKYLINFEIDLHKLPRTVTDNAIYYSWAYDQVLQGLVPNLVHVTCNVHIVRSVRFIFLKSINSLLQWRKCLNTDQFANCVSRLSLQKKTAAQSWPSASVSRTNNDKMEFMIWSSSLPGWACKWLMWVHWKWNGDFTWYSIMDRLILLLNYMNLPLDRGVHCLECQTIDENH